MEACAKRKPEIQPRYKLGAKIPPHPPPALVALEANTLVSRIRNRNTSIPQYVSFKS